MMEKLMGLVREEEGQGMTEYGLVLGVIAIAVLGIIVTLRGEIVQLYKEAVTAIEGRETATTAADGA
ncbi:Flp family type IVb pilin [Caldalkalibacillus salinus]|uniref:Flp family type IVb pilin n=1 Tax=Caldalkalibacillus salinus TaxID=2803787 RepID=UPI0019218256|nr:Flp family type IVb pilin [Caldalkalibacillus salinus]